jgi:hypothetical protein
MKNVKKYIFTNGFQRHNDLIRDMFDLKYSLISDNLLWKSSSNNILRNTSVFSFGNVEIRDIEQFKFRQKVDLKYTNSYELKNFLESRFDNDSRLNTTTNEEKIKQFSSSQIEFDDYTFWHNYAIKEESETMIDVVNSYNYYIRNYEERLKRLPEEVLPNFYVFSLTVDPDVSTVVESDFDGNRYFGENSTYINFANKFDNFITLNNNLSLRSSIPRGMEFFNKYSTTYDEVNVEFLDTYKKRFKNIVSDISDLDMIKEIEKFQFQYPMSIKISFSSDGDHEINDLFKQRNINGKIINDIKFSDTVNFSDKTLTEVQITNASVNSSLITNKTFQVSDFNQWLKDFINENNVIVPNEYYSSRIGDVSNIVQSVNIFSNPNENVLNLGSGGVEQNLLNNSADVLNEEINRLIIGNELNEIFINNTRTVEEIYDGEFAKSKTIFYKIEKKSQKTGNIIQTFYVVNIPGLNIINYIDTQVKPQKNYTYQIFAINIVFGTKYKYTGLSFLSDINEVERSEVNLGQAQLIQSNAIITSIDQQTSSIQFSENTQQSTVNLGEAQLLQSDAQIISIDQQNQDLPDNFNFSNSFSSKDTSTPQANTSIPTFGIRRTVVDQKETVSEVNQQIINQATPQVTVDVTEVAPSVINSSDFIQATELLTQSPYSDKSFSYYVDFEPSIKLVEVEYSTLVEGYVTDNPPIYPEVLFLPQKDKLNSFYICFFEIFSELEDYFNPIFESDENYGTYSKGLVSTTIAGIRTSFGAISDPFTVINFTKIKFKGDGDVSTIQVYRKIGEPFSYKEFELINEIDFKKDKNILQNIDINSDYYYFFRSIDSKNNISNPSPIYRCVLVSNGEKSFLDVKEHTLRVLKVDQESIKAKRYIKIKPSASQRLYSYQNDEIGLQRHKVYNNYFMMKIKSRHTGKQVKIKFKFKLDQNIQ